MKKQFFLTFIFSFCVIFTTYNTEIYADGQPVSVIIDGFFVQFADEQPMLIEGSVFVPLQDVFQNFGIRVNHSVSLFYNTVTLERPRSFNREAVYIHMHVGENFMTINNNRVHLNTPARMVNGNVMLPLRAVADAFGLSVEWDAQMGIARISDIFMTPSFIESHRRRVDFFLFRSSTFVTPLIVTPYGNVQGPDRHMPLFWGPGEMDTQIRTRFRNMVEVAQIEMRQRYGTYINGLSIGYPGVVGLRSDGTVIVALPTIRMDGTLVTDQNLTETLLPYHRMLSRNQGSGPVPVGVGDLALLNMDVIRNQHAAHVESVERFVNEVTGWNNIVSIRYNGGVLYGLRSDGTVAAIPVAPGDRIRNNLDLMMPDILNLQNIVAIEPFQIGIHNILVALRNDGTIEIVSSSDSVNMEALSTFRDIAAISSAGSLIFGLRSNGTLVASDLLPLSSGSPVWHNIAISTWTDIIAISSDGDFISGVLAGLRSDGTVVMAGSPSFNYELSFGNRDARDLGIVSIYVYDRRDYGSVRPGGFVDSVYGFIAFTAEGNFYTPRGSRILLVDQLPGW